MTKILTVTDRNNLERMVALTGEHEGDIVVVFDKPRWEGEVTELMHELSPNSLLIIPYTSKIYIERQDIRVYRYGNILRDAGKGVFYPNVDPGRMLMLPEGLLSEIAFALIEVYGLPDDRFSSLTLHEDPFYVVESPEEIETVLKRVPFSVPVKVIFDADSYDSPKRLVSALSRSSMLLVRKKGIDGEKAFSKALDRLVFSPVIHKLASFLFFEDEEDIKELLNDDIKCIRMFFRGFTK